MDPQHSQYNFEELNVLVVDDQPVHTELFPDEAPATA